ncbi:hypothetical protein, partial [Enterococcus faecium]|uniref:hypothetical protein n=1 Tax=Enterococcus faecium TaxID=1352 RepID=UPI001C40091B
LNFTIGGSKKRDVAEKCHISFLLKALRYLLLNSFFMISDKNGIQKLNLDQSATFTTALSTMFSEYFQ